MCSSDGRVVSVNSVTWWNRAVSVPPLSGSSPVVTGATSISEKRVVGQSSRASPGANSSCRDKASAVLFL